MVDQVSRGLLAADRPVLGGGWLPPGFRAYLAGSADGLLRIPRELPGLLADVATDAITGPVLGGPVGQTVLSLLPGSGEAMAVEDSRAYAADGWKAIRAGRYGDGAGDYARSLAAGLGAVPVLGEMTRPVGRVVGKVADATIGGKVADATVGSKVADPTIRRAAPEVVKEERTIRDLGPGPFGPTYEAASWPDALGEALRRREGEIVGQMTHESTGPIGVPWGKPGTGNDDGYGLSKIWAYHPEVLRDLPSIVEAMTVTTMSPNRTRLESQKHKAAVSMNFQGDPVKWLLTTYGKE